MIWFFPSPGIPQQQPMQQATDIRAEEQKAADEAARKSRLDASNRQGSRMNLLTSPDLMQTFGSTPTARKNLMGVG